MKIEELNKNQFNILLLEGVHQSAIDNFQQAGYENIELLPSALSEEKLSDAIKKAHFLGIRSRSQLTDAVFKSADNLLAVGCFCIGTNQVNLHAATKRGVPVFNAPFSNTRSVAELVIAEAILLKRGIAQCNAQTHQGVWKKSAKNSHEVRGKKLGIIGYGNIGSQVSVLAESIGMKVFFYDVTSKLPIGNAEQILSLPTLLNECDIITLHVPENPQTHNMIGHKELKQMKVGGVLINASRGHVVDINALYDALESGHLSGAAIDVYPEEPHSNNEPFASPLQKFDNVILTPHIAGSTIEAQENIGVEVSKKIIKFHTNGSSVSSINFPEVSLPSHDGVHRLLHIHQNIPGVLSEVNRIFSEHNINISSQFLQTNEHIGYVVTDVEAEKSNIGFEKLREVEGTIRTRIIF